ncbi:MAG: GNAT family N-acetyltransferase [Rubrobacter sp.]|nr:GNAT family N-acetyltransferase [Rubrobacter sp.]
MKGLPEGFFTRTSTFEDAEEVAALLSAGAFPGSGEEGMTPEEIRDDWEDIDLTEEAIAVISPDGRIAGYADVVNRSFVAVSVYGYVHPEFRGRGVGSFLVAWERTGRESVSTAPQRKPASAFNTTSKAGTRTRGAFSKTPNTLPCARPTSWRYYCKKLPPSPIFLRA